MPGARRKGGRSLLRKGRKGRRMLNSVTVIVVAGERR
jgi:hypothetical protein